MSHESEIQKVSQIEMEKPTPLAHTQSLGAMTMSPELFEKLYLTPKTNVPGDLRKRFANPTPLGFLGFVIAAFTFAMVTMGWGGADGLQGVVGIFFFTGPVLLFLATVFEWVMGNFFSMMVCGLFTVFWLSFGVINLPTLALAASYSTTGSAEEGSASVPYNAALALYLIVWGFALLTFAIFALKTNVVIVSILLFGTMAAFSLSAAFWNVASKDYEKAGHLQKLGGAFFFVVSALGWYMLLVQMCIEMDMPIKLPAGDLSHFWRRQDLEMNNNSERE